MDTKNCKNNVLDQILYQHSLFLASYKLWPETSMLYIHGTHEIFIFSAKSVSLSDDSKSNLDDQNNILNWNPAIFQLSRYSTDYLKMGTFMKITLSKRLCESICHRA